MSAILHTHMKNMPIHAEIDSTTENITLTHIHEKKNITDLYYSLSALTTIVIFILLEKNRNYHSSAIPPYLCTIVKKCEEKTRRKNEQGY